MARRSPVVADAPVTSNGHVSAGGLTASGQRLSQTKLTLEVQSRGWVARAKEWQKEVIGYADAMGTIGYGVGQMSGSMGKARWFIATRENPQDEPVDAVEAGVEFADLAFEQLQRLGNSLHGLPGITATGAWNWQVPGEFYVVGEGTGDGLGTSEQWDVRSVEEVTSETKTGPDGNRMDIFSITEDEGMQPRKLDPADSFVSRLWRRHPIRGRQATSYMRALRTECVVRGSQVFTWRGPVPVEEVEPGDVVWTWEDGQLVAAAVSKVWARGVRETVTVRTHNRSLTVTPEHPVLVFRQGHPGKGRRSEVQTEWVAASDVKRGDMLVVSTGVPSAADHIPTLPDGSPVTEGVAWLLGAFAADGHLGDHSVFLSTADDPEFHARFAEVARDAWNLRVGPVRRNGTCCFHSVRVSRSLRAIGYGARSTVREVPELIRAAPAKIQRAFLEGYETGDACIRPNGHIAYALTSERMAGQLRAINQMLGRRTSNLNKEDRKPLRIATNRHVTEHPLPLWRFEVYPDAKHTGRSLLRTDEGRTVVGRDFAVEMVRSITEGGEQEVYDLSVPGPASFIADGVVSHNCDEYLILSRGIRSSGRARSNNGLLLLPSGLKVAPLSAVDDATPGRGAQTLGDELMEGWLVPIADEGAASAVLPIFVEGAADLLDKVRHVTIDRPIDPVAAAQRQELITRINEGMNWPVEIGTGLGGSNHWNAWAITESMFDSHVAPELTLLGQSLWTGVVRPLFLEALVTQKRMTEEAALEASRGLFIWYDGTALISKPNVVSDVLSAANGVYPIVNGAFARKAVGASEEDAPTEEELALRAEYIAATAGRRIGATIPGEDIGPPPAIPAPSTDSGPPRAQTTTASAITAAAKPRNAKRAKLGAKLGAIDRALFVRLEAAASAALTRALERAGNRVRSRAQRNEATRSAVASGVPAADVAATLGPSMVASLGFADPDLLDGSFDDLAAKFDTWTARAQAQARAAIADAAGDDALDDVATEQDNRRSEAVAFLIPALAALAAQRLYDPHPAAPPLGEHDSTMTVPPGLIRDALARAGGAGGSVDANGPTGGVATGVNIRDYLNNNGTPQTSWEWSYGDSEREFPAHVDLDGVTFGSWEDDVLAVQAGDEWIGERYSVGDHVGCRCIATPLYDEGTGGADVSESEAA